MPVAPVAPVARKLRRDTEPKHALAGLLPLATHCRLGFPTWNLGGPLSLSNVEYITKSPAMSSSDGLPVAASFYYGEHPSLGFCSFVALFPVAETAL